MKKVSKTEAKKQIEEFFSDIRNKSPKEIKKIKKLAMRYNLPLKEKRKLFCKKCLSPYFGKEKIRIKNKFKTIICKNCNYMSRWKLKINSF
jgi:RNase P subunit RPR2